MVDQFEFMQYIDTLGIPYKDQGEELAFEHCPFCESSGKAKKPYGAFYFNKAKQTYYCHHRNSCGEQGGLYTFKIKMGHVDPLRKVSEKRYTKPKKDDDIDYGSEKFYQMYQDKRGIPADVLRKYQVGLKRHGEKRYIVYQFIDQKGEVINRKYRNFFDKKEQRQEKGAEQVYYGMQHVDNSKDFLHICEGEDDCHALSKIGIDNVVSVPSGATTYTPAMDRFNQNFETLYLMFDADEKGQEGARKFAEKAGMHKCKNVLLRYKDARECLNNNLDIFDIQKSIGEATHYRHEDIITATEYREKFLKNYKRVDDVTGRMTQMSGFNRIVGGIRLGEMTVLTGHTGRGKSTFAYNLALWCEKVGFRVLILNFENTMKTMFEKLIAIDTGKMVSMYDEMLQRWKINQSPEWFREQYLRLENKKIWYLDKDNGSKDGYYDVSRIESILSYAYKFYNINIIIIDHLHYFLKVSDVRNPTYAIDEAIRKMSMWKTRYNAHILCITHPHKTEDSRTGKPVRLGLYSGKGSSAIPQEADNYWVIRIDGNNPVLDVMKNRAIGKTGEVRFEIAENNNTLIDC